MLGQWMIVGMIFAVCIALSFPLFAAIERITLALDDRKFRRYWRTYGQYMSDLRIRRMSCDCTTCRPERRFHYADIGVRWPGPVRLHAWGACYLPPEKEG